ncbi:MAG: inorganic pyrophosphatase Ppa [Thermodesulfobacteriota bacterium]
MSARNYLGLEKKLALQVYKRPEDEALLQETHIAFTGAPQKHYLDPEKVVLVADPFSRNTSYYEFLASDISFVEELQTTVDIDGHAVPLVRIWVKKKSIGIRSTPFMVADTSWPA